MGVKTYLKIGECIISSIFVLNNENFYAITQDSGVYQIILNPKFELMRFRGKPDENIDENDYLKNCPDLINITETSEMFPFSKFSDINSTKQEILFRSEKNKLCQLILNNAFTVIKIKDSRLEIDYGPIIHITFYKNKKYWVLCLNKLLMFDDGQIIETNLSQKNMFEIEPIFYNNTEYLLLIVENQPKKESIQIYTIRTYTDFDLQSSINLPGIGNNYLNFYLDKNPLITLVTDEDYPRIIHYTFDLYGKLYPLKIVYKFTDQFINGVILSKNNYFYFYCDDGTIIRYFLSTKDIEINSKNNKNEKYKNNQKKFQSNVGKSFSNYSSKKEMKRNKHQKSIVWNLN